MAKKILFYLCITVLAGCASVTKGDPARDAALKSFGAPQAEKAGLYICRNELFGGAIGMDVRVDGKPVGRTVAKTYLYVEVAPGIHNVTSHAENTDSIEIDTLAGKLYYLWQEAKMGFLYARTKLNLISESVGQECVRESTFVTVASD